MAQTPVSYRNFVRGYFPKSYRPEFERFVQADAKEMSALVIRIGKVD